MAENAILVELEDAMGWFSDLDAAATASLIKSLTEIQKHTLSPNMGMYKDSAAMLCLVILGIHRNDDRLTLEGLRGLADAFRTVTLMLSVLESVAATRAREAKKKKHGYVYYAQADNGLIKIGTSVDPIRRLNGLRSQSSECGLDLLAVSEGGEEEEKRMHALFATERCHGEWFEPSAALLKHINAVKAANKDTEDRMRANHSARGSYT